MVQWCCGGTEGAGAGWRRGGGRRRGGGDPGAHRFAGKEWDPGKDRVLWRTPLHAVREVESPIIPGSGCFTGNRCG
jgi:hypothetical protein